MISADCPSKSTHEKLSLYFGEYRGYAAWNRFCDMLTEMHTKRRQI